MRTTTWTLSSSLLNLSEVLAPADNPIDDADNEEEIQEMELDEENSSEEEESYGEE
jgi:hypothetical protein